MYPIMTGWPLGEKNIVAFPELLVLDTTAEIKSLTIHLQCDYLNNNRKPIMNK